MYFVQFHPMRHYYAYKNSCKIRKNCDAHNHYMKRINKLLAFFSYFCKIFSEMRITKEKNNKINMTEHVVKLFEKKNNLSSGLSTIPKKHFFIPRKFQINRILRIVLTFPKKKLLWLPVKKKGILHRPTAEKKLNYKKQ